MSLLKRDVNLIMSEGWEKHSGPQLSFCHCYILL